jgi:N-acetylmuramoyl-L-alanine amidase
VPRVLQNLSPTRICCWTAAALLLTSTVSLTASLALPPTRTAPRLTHKTPWEEAEHARDTLEASPESSRSKADYTRVLDAFRAVYHDSPRDLHAAASVYAVAELLGEQGRLLHDPRSSQAAIGQYEFLRTQYPGSSLRIPALLAEAQIEANDLNDHTAAKQSYQLLLKRYPHSEQAEEARAGILSLTQPPRDTTVPDAKPDLTAKVQPEATSASVVPAQPKPATRSTLPPNPNTGIPDDADIPSPLDGNALPISARQGGAAPAKPHGPLAQVTGIRHWSTPTYTRVAIDLGDDVTFEAARVPNPDRIYFDLHGARLAQELVGKSFTVTDNGFLKKIRAAQFSNDMTRVVLDVSDVSEYSAFLLPSPYRLIIDIHGGKLQPTAQAATAAAPKATDVPAPRTASVPKDTSTHPVPNTVTSRSTSTTEIASLSDQPGKVEATSRPTSQPISAVVTPHDKSALPTAAGTSDSASQLPATPAPPSPTPAPSSTSTTPSSKHRKSKTSTSDATIATDATPARAAQPTADGETSLVRALGLKIGRIVIDPGHGGHDSGTLGADGIEEKDVVLDVALRLGKLLHERLGAEIIYTRSDDTFIPLETRTAIANKAQADLFLSIHANSSSDPTARGVETYYLNFTSSPDALETAARENAVSTQSIHQLSDLVKKITLKDKIDESREFAADVEQSLYGGLAKGNEGLKNRGVKKAPFVVLIGANMPSILAEISFVTNPRDASQLRQPEYRERVAESLYKGVAKYESGLSGIKPPTLRASTATDTPHSQSRAQ